MFASQSSTRYSGVIGNSSPAPVQDFGQSRVPSSFFELADADRHAPQVPFPPGLEDVQSQASSNSDISSRIEQSVLMYLQQRSGSSAEGSNSPNSNESSRYPPSPPTAPRGYSSDDRVVHIRHAVTTRQILDSAEVDFLVEHPRMQEPLQQVFNGNYDVMANTGPASNQPQEMPRSRSQEEVMKQKVVRFAPQLKLGLQKKDSAASSADGGRFAPQMDVGLQSKDSAASSADGNGTVSTEVATLPCCKFWPQSSIVVSDESPEGEKALEEEKPRRTKRLSARIRTRLKKRIAAEEEAARLRAAEE